MMTGWPTSPLTSAPSIHASELPPGAPESAEKADHVEVLRDPYEWKSAVGLATALFVASLALAPAPAVDHRKFAAEINTKTLRAAAAVKVAPKPLLSVRY